jgi:broad specificity phosphatase PhoE
VVLIRHGETEWSRSGQHTSRTDLPLTPAGERHAKALPALIASLGLRDPLVIASPRQRATRTAELAGLRVNHTWDALTEWDYGEYEGLTTEQIRKKVPGWTVWTHPCPGGESAQAVGARANRAIAVAEDQLAKRDVIFVGHGHFSRALLARWAELPVVEGRRFIMSAGAMSVLSFERDVRVIVSHNIVGDR